MSTITALKKLRRLERQARKLRGELGCSRPGEVVFQASRGIWSNQDVVVEADGFGGAKLLVVEGNYPIDYSTKLERRFRTEDEACETAEAMAR